LHLGIFHYITGGKCMENGVVAERAERSALLIGHPGHELRLFDWIGRAQPTVCLLTDGSGSEGVPRIDTTLEILRRRNVSLGPICGEFTDRGIYAHMLNGDGAPVFAALRDRIADWLLHDRIDVLVSDGIEGYNPTHDLCHALAAAAVARANRSGASVAHLCIPLMGDPQRFADGASPTVRSTVLSEHAHREKMETIRAYAMQSGSTLQQEVDETLRAFGEDAFTHECLFDAGVPSWEFWKKRFGSEEPYYETYGRAQVAAGRYKFVISFEEHIRPLVDHLLLDDPVRDDPDEARAARAHA
jgi:hypothetical protein